MALGIIPRAIHNTTNPLFEVLTGLSPYRLAARLPKSPFFEVSARNRACGSLLRVVTYTLGTELSIIRFLHTYALMESTAQYWKPGRSGANSELCARCRAAIVADSDAQNPSLWRQFVPYPQRLRDSMVYAHANNHLAGHPPGSVKLLFWER